MRMSLHRLVISRSLLLTMMQTILQKPVSGQNFQVSVTETTFVADRMLVRDSSDGFLFDLL